MAFKMNGFNPGAGTGMGSSPNKMNSPTDKSLVGNQKNLPPHLRKKIEAAPPLTAKEKFSPNKIAGEIVKGAMNVGKKVIKRLGGVNLADGLPKGSYDISNKDGMVTYKVKGHKGEFSVLEKDVKKRIPKSPNKRLRNLDEDSPNRMTEKAKTPNKKDQPEADSANDHYRAKQAKINAEYEAAKKSGDKEAMMAAAKKMQALASEVKQYDTDLRSGDAPGSYGVQNRTGKMSDFKIGSAERKAEYDRRGWAYDDTITGKKKEPEADPTPDPTNINNPEFAKKVKPNVGELTDPEYMRSSKKGRKTTTVVRKDDKIATDEYTDRNIGDKRVRTYTGDPRGDMRYKEKFDKKGNKKKDKKKITLADGTVIKEKTTRGGKKKVKIRKKGQLFARRVK